MIENINSKLRFRVRFGVIKIIGFLRKQKMRMLLMLAYRSKTSLNLELSL